MARLLPREGVAIDVGAHKGAYAYRMARLVGPRGRVIALEPQDRLAARTASAIRSAGLRWVELLQAAASDRSGTAPMDYRELSTHGAALDGLTGADVRHTTVRVLTLDSVAADRDLTRLDFIKIDVEGHEQAVLRGGLACIARHHPAILVEIETRHHDREADPFHAARVLLEPLGYTPYAFVGADCTPALGIDPERLRAASGEKGGVSNNFLFLIASQASRMRLTPPRPPCSR